MPIPFPKSLWLTCWPGALHNWQLSRPTMAENHLFSSAVLISLYSQRSQCYRHINFRKQPHEGFDMSRFNMNRYGQRSISQLFELAAHAFDCKYIGHL